MTSFDTEAFANAVRVDTSRRSEEVTGWALPHWVRHFSPPSLGMFQRCPEQYRQRYILGIKERPTSNLTLGTASHSAIEHNLIQKIDSHTDLPATEVVEYFYDEAWPKAIARDGGSDEIEWTREEDDARATGAKMTNVFHEQVAPRIQPISTEEEFSIEWGGPRPLFGKIDCTTELDVHDWKTSSKKVTKMKPAWRLQGGIYMAAKQKPVSWDIITSAKEPTVVTPFESEDLRQQYSIEAVKTTLMIVDRLVWAINEMHSKYSGDPQDPTTSKPWPMMGYGGDSACGWCGFKKYCAAWGNHVPDNIIRR